MQKSLSFDSLPVVKTYVLTQPDITINTNNEVASDIVIKCESGGTIELFTNPDCCSQGWFEFHDGDMDKIIGKSIKSISEGEKVDLPFSEMQDYDQNKQVIITFNDKSTFVFCHRNSSNGYYSNSFSIVAR